MRALNAKEPDPLYEFCRSLPGVSEDIKWENNFVFSVGSKMFVSFNFPDGEPFGFKTDPHVFADLTQREGIEPAPYLAKHSWVSVKDREALPLDELKMLIRESYEIVGSRLSRKQRSELGIE